MKPYIEKVAGHDVAIEMIPVPGGVFLMGSPAAERGRKPDEGPQHHVKLGPFWISKTEVRWDDYDPFAFKENPTGGGDNATRPPDAVTQPTPPYADETFGYSREGNPVISVTHNAAMEYTRWLSKKTGKDYRLPTEAEWEYACRAGSTTAYSFGNDAGALGEHAWLKDNSEEKPRAVGQKKPNAWGLHDMHGNVAEWVIDRYNPTFYARFKAKIPAMFPVLLPAEEEYPHVVRGGSWSDTADRLRCAARDFSNKEWNQRDPQNPQSIWWLTEAINVGFRIVRPYQEHESLKGLRSKTVKGAGTAPDK